MDYETQSEIIRILIGILNDKEEVIKSLRKRAWSSDGEIDISDEEMEHIIKKRRGKASEDGIYG